MTNREEIQSRSIMILPDFISVDSYSKVKQYIVTTVLLFFPPKQLVQHLCRPLCALSRASSYALPQRYTASGRALQNRYFTDKCGGPHISAMMGTRFSDKCGHEYLVDQYCYANPVGKSSGGAPSSASSLCLWTDTYNASPIRAHEGSTATDSCGTVYKVLNDYQAERLSSGT